MPEKRGKILVIRGGAIGDFILTLPALAALRSTFPHTHLELLGYPVVAGLARAGGLVDAFRSIEARPLARFFARHAPLDPEWSAYFESFNLIISYLYDPDEIFKTNVARASQAQFTQAQHRPLETEELHATSVFLKPLEQLAIFDMDSIPQLSLGPLPARPDRARLAAHPGSGGVRKNWPEEKWIELLEGILRDSREEILLVGGEAEGERLARMMARLRPFGSERVKVAQNVPLAELAELLGTCRAFIGHDSGITHLAAALGLPVLAIWGPSNAGIWRPPQPQVTLLHGGPELEDFPVTAVRDAVETLLKKNQS